MSNIDVNNLVSKFYNCNLEDPTYQNLINEIKVLKEKIKFLESEIVKKDNYINGSKTAKNGFKEEDKVVEDINNINELNQNLVFL